MKTVYSTPASESTDEARISVLLNTLSQLRLANIATLDALMTHFTRLIELTSADESYVSALATALAPCILRPKQDTSLTMEEKYSYRLIRDLFAHKEAIFSELKRASSLSHSHSVETRPRAISTDESNRKANMEARARAIIASGSRSRATSPAPSPRGHRRDRSSGGPETRFPVAPATPTTPEQSRAPRSNVGNSTLRQSLEVPIDALELAQPPQPLHPITNGSDSKPVTSATYYPSANDDMPEDIGVGKRDSLGRSGHATGGRYAGRRPVGTGGGGVKRDSLEETTSARRGVSLTDKPMDD